LENAEAFVATNTEQPVATVHFSKQAPATSKPMLTWSKVTRAVSYEIELFTTLPEESANHQSNVKPFFSTQKIYVNGLNANVGDYPENNYFYWRVRGLDAKGNPVGVYSDAGSFIMNPQMHVSVAALGDSITHGGGNVSHSPADWEYSYLSYLDFPALNLGKSGDTSQTTVERFEQDVLPFQPQYLLILTGTNSLRGGVQAESVIEDLKILKEKCLVNNIRPIFLTLPPINPGNIEKVFHEMTAPDYQEQMRLVNRFIRTQEHIDVEQYLLDAGILSSNLATDGLHPNVEGKKRMAEAINGVWQRFSQ